MMKRLLLCSLAGLVLSVAPAQVKLRVFLGGKPVGNASLTQRLGPDGSKSVQLSMELTSGDVKVLLRSESSYASNGMPIRKFQETSVPSQKYRRTRIVTFDSKGANLVADLNGTRTTKQIPLDSKANRADMSEFWFLRDKPKKGDRVAAYTFDMENLVWSLVETTYEGQVDLMVSGKKVRAHQTKTTHGAAFFDASGEPLRLELPNGAMERLW